VVLTVWHFATIIELFTEQNLRKLAKNTCAALRRVGKIVFCCLPTKVRKILYTKQYFLLISCHLYYRIILLLLALFIDMKLDTTNFI